MPPQTPGFSLGGAAGGDFGYSPNATGGVNYFRGSAPITNAQYDSAQTLAGSGLRSGAIESQAAAAYQQPKPQLTGGAGGSAAASSTNPDYGVQTADINNHLGELNGLYNTLFGDFNAGVAGQKSTIDQQYGDLQSGLNNQFQQLAPQLRMLNNARGIGDSSYAATDYQNASDTYNQQSTQNQDAMGAAEQNLERNAQNQLGQYQGQLKGFQDQAAQLPQITNDASSNYRLSTIQTALDTALGPVQGAIGSAQSPQQLSQELGTQGAAQVQNPQALMDQLKTLSQSSVPQFAQDQIASGYIGSQAGNNNNYLLNYYKNLTTPQAA